MLLQTASEDAGLADAIVEITETESTIKAHGLRIIHELMQTNTGLIANHKAWENPEKRAKIRQMAMARGSRETLWSQDECSF